jgi:hypothetical protein
VKFITINSTIAQKVEQKASQSWNRQLNFFVQLVFLAGNSAAHHGICLREQGQILFRARE